MTKRLRVGIDAWGMGRASLFTGMGQYTANLLRGLPAMADVEAVAFGGPEEPRPGWLAPEVEWLPVGEARLGRFAAIDNSMRCVPRRARAERLDVFHAPSVHVRPSFPPVPRATCPLIVTMHDAIPLSYYGDALPTRTRAFYRWNVRRIRRASRVLTVSSAAAEEIAAFAAVPLEKTSVVASAVEFAPQHEPEVLAAAGIPREYFLFAGSYEPRKNLVGTLHAFDRYVREGGRGDLVAVTESASGHAAAAHAVLDALACRARVHLVHDVPEPVLRALYTEAIAVVFPSFAEGLGLPPIQAVQCETPVVVSELAVFDETIGSVAVTVAAADPSAIAAGMQRAATDPEVRARTRTAAAELRKRYSLAACIGDHVAVYRSVAARQHAFA